MSDLGLLTLRASPAKDNGLNGNSSWVLPLWMDDGALAGRAGEASIGMCSLARVTNLPLLAQPGCDLNVLDNGKISDPIRVDSATLVLSHLQNTDLVSGGNTPSRQMYILCA